MGLHLAPFDPAANFKAAKNFRYGGHAIVMGTLIDKTLVEPAKLRLLYESHYITVAADDEVEAAGGAPDALTADQQSRVDQLVADNNREQLNAMAAGEPYKIAGAEALGTKADVATAIVRAEAA